MCLKLLRVQVSPLAESERRERVKQMTRVFYGHLLSENEEVHEAAHTCLEGCLKGDKEYAPKLVAPYVLAFLDTRLNSSLDLPGKDSAMNLLGMLCRSLGKAQRRNWMARLVKLLQLYETETLACKLNVLYRMKELWTLDAVPKATFPEAYELLLGMMRSTSLDSELREAIFAMCFRY